MRDLSRNSKPSRNGLNNGSIKKPRGVEGKLYGRFWRKSKWLKMTKITGELYEMSRYG